MQGTDKEKIIRLVDAALTHDRKGQFELYRLYEKAMFSICMRMLNNYADAEDILQESFIEAFRNLEKFSRKVSFGAWLKRIVINRCINMLNKRKRGLVLVDENQLLDYAEQTDTTSERDQQNWERSDVDLINKAIQVLPDGYRVVFNLFLMEGYDHSEIAEILGISESTSKSQYSRAKKKLKIIVGAMKNS